MVRFILVVFLGPRSNYLSKEQDQEVLWSPNKPHKWSFQRPTANNSPHKTSRTNPDEDAAVAEKIRDTPMPYHFYE